MADGIIPEHYTEDLFTQDIALPPRGSSRKRSPLKARAHADPDPVQQTSHPEPAQQTSARAGPPFKSFCGQVGRLLGRITADCAEGTEDYERVTAWFCQWLNQLGVIFRFVKRPEDEFVRAPHYTAFCRRASDGVRSAFYLLEETGEELVRLSRLPKFKRSYTATSPCLTDEQALQWAEGIQCFLNASTEPGTFARFLEEISK